MAVPVCPSCKSSLFETAELTPQGYKHRLLSVHCTNCGSIAAVLDQHGIGARLDRLENLVESLVTRLDNLPR